jgi:tRNA pseudouridine55 synthase
MNGVLNIDKPAGMTSHDVVAHVRRLAKIKRVGHAGTLDPDATGVLLVCLGQSTRLAEYLAEQGKTYECVLSLGTTTDTEDSSGLVLEQIDAEHITEKMLRDVLPRFVGEIMQVPPMVSAVHHQGKRLYELARAGITVEREPRPVTIDGIELIEFNPGKSPTAILNVVCGKGTYIRTLCADIGQSLGVGGHMFQLRRSSVGSFRVDEASDLSALTSENVSNYLVKPTQAVRHLPQITLANIDQYRDIMHGRAVPCHLDENTIAGVIDEADNLVAIGRVSESQLHPFKVLVQELK